MSTHWSNTSTEEPTRSESTCAFCQKTRKEVNYMIAVGKEPAICDECIVTATLLIAERMEVKPSQVISQLMAKHAEMQNRAKEQAGTPKE